MKYSNTLALAMLGVGSLAVFSDTEIHLVQSLRGFFNAGFLIFVEDEINSTRITNEVKKTSEYNVASITITSEQLKSILERDHGFSWRRTLVATKTRIVLGPLLRLVESARHLVWVLFSEPLDNTTVGDDIPYNGHILRIRAESDAFRINELLRPIEGRERPTREFGFIRTDTKQVHLPDQKAHKLHRMNLSGIDLRIGLSKEPCEKRKDGVLLEKIFCYHSKILDILSEKLNFNQIAITHSGDNYSFVAPNGSYSGFFKMLIDGEADLSAAGFVVTGKRMDDFGFIWPTFVLETMMYVKKSDANVSLNSTPFSKWIWATTSLWIVVMGAFLLVSNRFNRESESAKGSVWYALYNDVLNVLQLTCSQGSSDFPSFSASRILYSTILFGGMLLYYYYSAMVLSYLTIESLNVPFNNIDGFVENGKYKIIGLADGFAIYFVKFEGSLLKHRTTDYIENEENLPTDLENGIQTLCNGKFLTLLELRGSILNVEKSECELTEIPSPVLLQFFGFATVKEFQLGEYFSAMLWRLNELGLIERMRNNLSKFDNLKAMHEDDEYQTVTLEQINNLLTMLTTGILLCLLVLIAEMWKPRKKNKTFRGKIRNARKQALARFIVLKLKR